MTFLPADNSRKTPIARSLNAIAAQRAADNHMAQPQEVPCRVESVDGQIVTVSIQVFGGPFQGTIANVSVPIGTALYDWMPVQAGDLGILKKSDYYLGGISGQGGGTADWTQRGNLSTHYFQPVSNVNWTLPASASGNPNVRVVQGPAGVGLQDVAGKTTVLINANGIVANVQNVVKIVVTDTTVTVTVPTGQKIVMTAGGTPAQVMTTAGASPVLYADGP